MGGAVKRVLIYRLGSLGDTIVALPALRVVERAFPEADRRLLTNLPISSKAASSVTILENTGLVNGYMRYVAGTRSVLEILALWWRIVRWRPQVLIYLAGPRGLSEARRDKIFFRLCGIRTFYGVPETEAAQQIRYLPERELYEPEAERLCRIVAEFGPPHLEDRASWDLCLTDSEFAEARAALGTAAEGRLIAMSLGTKAQVNEWEREKWRLLLANLAARYPGYGLLMGGAPDESAACEWVAKGWRSQPGSGPVVNACGRLSLRATACAYAMASVFIGHDSGPGHMAAAAGTRCVGIFSARNLPGVWFPYGAGNHVIYHPVECMGCRLETCIVEKKRCITSITQDEVLAAVVSVLDARAMRDGSERGVAVNEDMNLSGDV